jgi:mannose-6-phosphate isomerase-like protein (cupin superfamily)
VATGSRLDHGGSDVSVTVDKPTPISIPDIAASIDDYFKPHNIVNFNGAILKISRLSGECKWHRHEGQEELFLCWKGTAIIRLEGEREVALQEGELYVVPPGIMHQSAAKDAFVLHVELPKGTIYPGEANKG